MNSVIKTIVSFVMFCSLNAASAASVSGVSANQRWPWNNLIDVDFTISGSESSVAYRVELSATYNNGANKVYANSYLTEPVVEGDGSKRVTWDLGADMPGLKTDDFTVTVSITPIADNAVPVYLVIDLSAGPEATKYPIRYTTKAPDLSNDKCRTTEMWLRRIKTGTPFLMGGNDSDMNSYLSSAKEMTLTKDYYIAIFETTQQQWAQVMGEWPSLYSNTTYRATRPVDTITRASVRGSSWYYPWPNDNSQGAAGSVGKSTFAGKIRARTGITNFDLPTEAQWVYAALGGSTVSENNQKRGVYPSVGTINDTTVLQVARCGGDTGNGGGIADGDVGISETQGDLTGTMTVGHYQPNAYGLYDMLGNVWEIVLDVWASDWPEVVNTTDYKGPTTGGNSTLKGLPHNWAAFYMSTRARTCLETMNTPAGIVGVRFCVPLD